ncbi:hypothetical protein ES332_A10G258900v1 [Gossypium tomentosum]|nr:hypothetical protein ES332_A10G258900v1 [Gossypium tomentosum]
MMLLMSHLSTCFCCDGWLRISLSWNGVSFNGSYVSCESYKTCFCSCTDIRNWIRNIEQHASDNVNKVLVGNKADMDESKRAVPTSKGQALADEYGIKFFETSAKTNLNVEEVFFSIARDIKQRLTESDNKAEPTALKINQQDSAASVDQAAQKSGCCGGLKELTKICQILGGSFGFWRSLKCKIEL